MSSTRHMSFSGINFGYDANEIFDYRKKTICNNIIENYDNLILSETNNTEGTITIEGKISNKLRILSYTKQLYVKYWAASPCLKSISFSSFGIPFPNENIAFNNNYNVGMIKVVNGGYKFKLYIPNSYYINMGTKLVPPSVNIRIWDSDKSISDINIIKIGSPIPYRSISLPEKRNWSDGPLFYDNKNLKIRTQEQILLDSEYPFKTMKEHENYWGGKPPM